MEWFLQHTGALFYVQLSKSTSGPFEALSDLLLFFQKVFFFVFFLSKLQLIVERITPLLRGRGFCVWKQVLPSVLYKNDVEHL